jgi:hypothetical protein
MIWIIPAALVAAIIIKAVKWYKKEIKDYVDNEQNDVRNW